jgi:hypothetical protein
MILRIDNEQINYTDNKNIFAKKIFLDKLNSLSIRV